MSTQTMSEQIALLKNIIANLRGQVEEADATLERIRTALAEESGAAKQETDFTRLRYESGKHPYTGHPAARSSMPELYYLLLLTVLTSAEATEAQWMHLYRVAAGAGYEQDVRDLLPAAHAITDAKIIECVERLHRDNLVNAFLLDAMLLALLREESAAILEYIAELFALIGAPREAVNETIQAAKIIIAQDREAYLAAMREAIHLRARESYFYLYSPNKTAVVNDLVQIESIASEHLIVLCIEASNATLNLDTWEADKISFHDCSFENSTIKTSQKEVAFTGCHFYEKNANTGSTHLLAGKASTLTKCTFKNITAKTRVLSLYNATIEHCTFSDCTVCDAPLLNISSGRITSSEFTRCRCEGCDAPVSVSKTTIAHCNFSHCETYLRGHPSIINVHEHSSITQCAFKQCMAKSCYDTFRQIISLSSDSSARGNTFHDCSCYRYVS